MNYYNKLEKYIAKTIKYIGGASGTALTYISEDDLGGPGGGGIEARYRGYITRGYNGRDIIWLGDAWYVLNDGAIRYVQDHNIRASRDIVQPVEPIAPVEPIPFDGMSESQGSLERSDDVLKQSYIRNDSVKWMLTGYNVRFNPFSQIYTRGDKTELNKDGITTINITDDTYIDSETIDEDLAESWEESGLVIEKDESKGYLIYKIIPGKTYNLSTSLEWTKLGKQVKSDLVNDKRQYTLDITSEQKDVLIPHKTKRRARINSNRIYKLNHDNRSKLLDLIVKIMIDLPSEIHSDIDYTGIDRSDKHEFNNIMNVMVIFYPRFNEVWPILYEIILANPELLYNKKYEFDGSDTIDYGLPIIKSIYTDTKEFYKFKDGDDICMHGYNPHPHKCISFSGNESKKLLHWPAKECRFDNTESGCKLHQKVNCAFLHKKTLIKCPGISICHQIDFQIIGYERGRSPVVYFNGFKTVPNDGRWFRDLPFTNKNDKQCDFNIDEYVKIFKSVDDIKRLLDIPSYNDRWTIQIKRLIYDNSNDCANARIKLMSPNVDSTLDATEDKGNNDGGLALSKIHPISGHTMEVYFKQIPIKLLKKISTTTPLPVKVAKEEVLSVLSLTSNSAERKSKNKLHAFNILIKNHSEKYQSMNNKLDFITAQKGELKISNDKLQTLARLEAPLLKGKSAQTKEFSTKFNELISLLSQIDNLLHHPTEPKKDILPIERYTKIAVWGKLKNEDRSKNDKGDFIIDKVELFNQLTNRIATCIERMSTDNKIIDQVLSLIVEISNIIGRLHELRDIINKKEGRGLPPVEDEDSS